MSLKSMLSRTIVCLCLIVLAVYATVLNPVIQRKFHDLRMGISSGKINENSVISIGIIILIIQTVACGWIGYLLASRYGRNKYQWTTICAVFNVWGIAILWIIGDNRYKNKSK